MNKSYEYASKVISGEIVAPKQVKQACKHFIETFDTTQHKADYKYFWCEKTEKKVSKILNNLNFARGALSGKNIGKHLALWQYFFIQNIFCWQWKEFPGKRQIREVIMTVSRKNSKTILAGLVHIIAFYLDEKNAKHYLASNTKKQAENIFEEISDIIKESPMVAAHFKVRNSYIEFIPKNGKLTSLSGDSRRQDGGMPFVACVDEMGADNRISKMVGSLEGGQFGPRSPLIVKISTSYEISNAYNYWETVVDKLIKNTLSEKPNPKIFGLAYLIDNAKDEVEIDGVKMERWQDKSTWLESNPLVAEVDDLWEKLIEDYETTKDVPTDFLRFKVKNLNIWLPAVTENDERLIDLESLQLQKFEDAQDWKWWEGKQQVMIGLDASMSRDNTSVTFLWYDQDNDQIYIKNLVYYPKEMEAEKVKIERLPYDEWSKLDFPYCQPFGEKTVDWKALGPELHKIIEDYDIGVGTFLYDNKYAMDIAEYFDTSVEMEAEPHEVQQNSYHLGPLVSKMQKDLYDGNFFYAPNKLFEASCANAEIYYPMGKPYVRKPEGGKHKNKVDSVFSTLNALRGHMMFKQEELYGGKSYF